MKKRPNETHEQFQQRFVIAILRKASLQWYARSEAIKLARKERGRYECYICHNLFKKGEYDLDHITPVVQVSKGYTTLDEYVSRLLCKPDNFGICCKQCHEIKTETENQTRVSISKKKKKK